MITFLPVSKSAVMSKPKALSDNAHESETRLTFWTEGDTDSVSEDVDTLEDAGPPVVRELDLLVRTPRECWLRPGSFCGSTAKRTRGGLRDVVHD